MEGTHTINDTLNKKAEMGGGNQIMCFLLGTTFLRSYTCCDLTKRTYYKLQGFFKHVGIRK
jgi:hypothetical protein